MTSFARPFTPRDVLRKSEMELGVYGKYPPDFTYPAGVENLFIGSRLSALGAIERLTRKENYPMHLRGITWIDAEAVYPLQVSPGEDRVTRDR